MQLENPRLLYNDIKILSLLEEGSVPEKGLHKKVVGRMVSKGFVSKEAGRVEITQEGSSALHQQIVWQNEGTDRRCLLFLAAGPRKLSEIYYRDQWLSRVIGTGSIVTTESTVSITPTGQKHLYFGIPTKDRNIVREYVNAKSAAEIDEKTYTAGVFAELYSAGRTLQYIGDLFGVTRERVRQLVSTTDQYTTTKAKKVVVKTRIENKSKEVKKQSRKRKSILARYPERVAELWDYEKNVDISPDEVYASGKLVWWKCKNGGHSWQQKLVNMVISWGRYHSSGCPQCSGRTPGFRQPSLLQAYPEFVAKVWDFEVNDQANVDPSMLTLGSAVRVHLRCTLHSWKMVGMVHNIVNGRWKSGYTGCRGCDPKRTRPKK